MIIIYIIIAYSLYGGLLVWRDFHIRNFADRPLYAMKKLKIKTIIYAIFTRPYHAPYFFINQFIFNIKRNFEEKKETPDIKKIKYFQKNVINYNLVVDEVYNEYSIFPINSNNIGLILINDKNKTINIEFRETGTKSESGSDGAFYTLPCEKVGHLLCENVTYKIWNNKHGNAVMFSAKTDNPNELNLLDNTFQLGYDKKDSNKLFLLISNNLNGIQITCDKISVIDFKEVDVNDLESHRNTVVGCSYGQFFSIQHKN